MGGTGVTLEGRMSPALPIAWFDSLFRGIKERFPAVWLHSLSASEILAIAEQSGLTVGDTITRLRDAGLDSIPGDDQSDDKNLMSNDEPAQVNELFEEGLEVKAEAKLKH